MVPALSPDTRRSPDRRPAARRRTQAAGSGIERFCPPRLSRLPGCRTGCQGNDQAGRNRGLPRSSAQPISTRQSRSDKPKDHGRDRTPHTRRPGPGRRSVDRPANPVIRRRRCRDRRQGRQQSAVQWCPSTFFSGNCPAGASSNPRGRGRDCSPAARGSDLPGRNGRLCFRNWQDDQHTNRLYRCMRFQRNHAVVQQYGVGPSGRCRRVPEDRCRCHHSRASCSSRSVPGPDCSLFPPAIRIRNA